MDWAPEAWREAVTSLLPPSGTKRQGTGYYNSQKKVAGRTLLRVGGRSTGE